MNDNAHKNTNVAIQLEDGSTVNDIAVITVHSKSTDKSEPGKKKKTLPNMDDLIQASDLPDMIKDS